MGTKKVKNTKASKVSKKQEITGKIEEAVSPDNIAGVPITNSLIDKQMRANSRAKTRKSIKQMLGENHSEYEQETIEEYKKFIDDMTLADLEIHANGLGVPPSYEREILEKRLLREFNIRSSDYYANSVVQPVKKHKISDKMLRIIAEGR